MPEAPRHASRGGGSRSPPGEGWRVVSLDWSVPCSASRASLEVRPQDEAFWVPDLSTGAWCVAWWRAAQPPKPVPGFSGLFLATFVQISRPLTASQVAWF